MKRTSVPTHERLSRNVKVLSLVSFFQDTASEMLYPVLPYFLTSVLGAPVAVVGLIEGLAEGTASVMKAVAGRLSDGRRRRPFVAGGYGLAAVAKLIIAVAFIWPVVLMARVLDRLGKGPRSAPRDAVLAESARPGQRGRAFGLHRAADSAGAVVGPLLGLGLYNLLGQQLRPLFVIAVIPGAISVALVVFVHETTRTKRPSRARTPGWRTRFLPSAASPQFWRVLVFLAVFGLVNFTDALLILRAKDLGFGVSRVLALYALYNATYAGLAYPAGAWSDRIPRRLVFAAGLAIFAVAYLRLGLVKHRDVTVAAVPTVRVLHGVDRRSRQGMDGGSDSGRRVGSGLGLFQGVTGLTAVMAGVWAGLAWGEHGQLPLIVSGAVAGALAVVLVVGGRFFAMPPAGVPAARRR